MIRNCPTCLTFTPLKPKIKKKDMLCPRDTQHSMDKTSNRHLSFSRHKLPNPCGLHIKVPSSQTAKEDGPASHHNGIRRDLYRTWLPGQASQQQRTMLQRRTICRIPKEEGDQAYDKQSILYINCVHD